jgi:hypothetical protein
MENAVQEEPRWHAAIAVVVALALYVTLPPRIALGPLWLLPVLVLVILIPLMIVKPRRHSESTTQRLASISIIALLGAFNIGTIATLYIEQFSHHHRRAVSGEDLLLAAAEIWLTNVIVYALWFWEVDGNGPDVRVHASFDQHPRRADFLFPQMSLDPDMRKRLQWRPKFIDYLYLAFTNATAFSPADTFPLTPLAKVLMMAESLGSLVTIVLIASRAIGTLS